MDPKSDDDKNLGNHLCGGGCGYLCKNEGCELLENPNAVPNPFKFKLVGKPDCNLPCGDTFKNVCPECITSAPEPVPLTLASPAPQTKPATPSIPNLTSSVPQTKPPPNTPPAPASPAPAPAPAQTPPTKPAVITAPAPATQTTATKPPPPQTKPPAPVDLPTPVDKLQDIINDFKFF